MLGYSMFADWVDVLVTNMAVGAGMEPLVDGRVPVLSSWVPEF